MVESNACIRFQCICIDICTDLLSYAGLMCIIGKKNLCIVGKTGLVNSMSIVGFLNSTRVAAAGLNHPTKLLPSKCQDRSVFGQVP